MRNAEILGTGAYLPTQVVTNHDLEKVYETTHDWIVQRTGIHQRHQANQQETVYYMATKAAEQALQAAKIKPDQIGLIIVATCTGENVFPSAAGVVQKNIGAAECPAFNLSAACAGFVYALSFADAYIKTGQCDYALVIGSEVMSKVVNPEDRSTAVLFGDGAGAVVLGPTNKQKHGIIATELHCNAQYDEMLKLAQFYPGDKNNDPAQYYIFMQGKEVFKIAVEKLGNMVEKILINNGFNKSDLNWLVPHQANYRIIKAVANRLDLSEEQIILTIANHANTSAASIPLALHEGITSSKIKRDDLILLESFGGGLAWGSALVRY